MSQRIILLRNQMATQEQVIKQLHLQLAAVRGTPQETQLMARVKEMTTEFNKRKEYIQKFAPGWEAFRYVFLADSFLLCFYLFSFVKKKKKSTTGKC
jgi:uncharacterized coiled-coil protein SlyX